LSAFLCLLRWAETRRAAWLAAQGALLAGALLCQEAAAVLPFAYAAWLWLAPERRRLLARPAPWLLWAGTLLAWLVGWHAIAGEGSQKAPGGYLAALFSNLPALVVYAGKLAFPYRLSVMPILADSPWVPGALALVAIAVLATALRGPNLRAFAWGVGWFLLGI